MAERHLWDAKPRYALVLWPDAADGELPDCISLRDVADALAYGAVLVAREDDTFCRPRERVRWKPKEGRR